MYKSERNLYVMRSLQGYKVINALGDEITLKFEISYFITENMVA